MFNKIRQKGLIAAGLCSLVLFAGSFTFGSDNGSEKRDDPLKPERQWQNTFHESLSDFDEKDPERVKYESRLYLLDLMARHKGPNSVEAQCLDSLMKLDVNLYSNLVNAVLTHGLSSLDYTFGNGGEEESFFDQLDKRALWTLQYGGHISGGFPVAFDDLGKWVLQRGIPEVIKRSSKSILVKFADGMADEEWFFKRDNFGYYRGVEYYTHCGEKVKPFQEFKLKEMKMSRTVVTEVPWDEALEISLSSYTFPCNLSDNPWRTPEGDWPMTRAGIEARLNLEDVSVERKSDSAFVEVLFEYEVCRAGSGKVVSAGRFQADSIDVTGASKQDGIYLSMLSNPFSTAGEEDEGAYKLSLKATSGEKVTVKNVPFNVEQGVCEFIILDEEQPVSSHGVPKAKVRNLSGNINLGKGKTYEGIMPVMNLFSQGEDYSGQGEVIILKAGDKAGRVIVDRKVEKADSSKGGSRTIHACASFQKQYAQFSIEHFEFDSRTPNEYLRITFLVPESIESGPSTLYVPIYSSGPRGCEEVMQGRADVEIID